MSFSKYLSLVLFVLSSVSYGNDDDMSLLFKADAQIRENKCFSQHTKQLTEAQNQMRREMLMANCNDEDIKILKTFNECVLEQCLTGLRGEELHNKMEKVCGIREVGIHEKLSKKCQSLK